MTVDYYIFMSEKKRHCLCLKSIQFIQGSFCCEWWKMKFRFTGMTLNPFGSWISNETNRIIHICIDHACQSAGI